MEFRLPFPTLRDLAARSVAHCLIKLEYAGFLDYSNRKTHFYECREQLKKLDIPDQLKCHIREALNCTADFIADMGESCGGLLCTKYHQSPKLVFDVYGIIDELAMARRHLGECYKDRRYEQDSKALRSLLKLACNYTSLRDIDVILCQILTLQAKDVEAPRVTGPDFKDHDGKLCLKYTFVDQRGMQTNFAISDFDYEGYGMNSIKMKTRRDGFDITLTRVYYDSELLNVHLNLIASSKRLEFVSKLLAEKSTLRQFRQFVDILNFLDPETRQHYLTHKFGRSRHCFKALRCLLMWPFQMFFLPTLELTKSNLQFKHLLDLFLIIIDKLHMEAFEEILMPFWDAIPSADKSDFSEFGGSGSLLKRMKNCFVHLMEKSPLLYEQIMQDFEFPDSSGSEFEPAFDSEDSDTSFEDYC